MTLEQSQCLWNQDLLEWLEEIKTITDDEKKVQALTSFVTELLPSQSTVLQQALDIASNLNEFDQTKKVLTAIVTYLPESEQKILQKTLKIVRGIKDESLRSEALIRIAPHLPTSQQQSQQQWIQEVYEIAQNIENNYYQARALAFIVPLLSTPESTEVLKQALLIIENYELPYELARTLANIASRLPKPQSQEVLTQALKVVQNINADLVQAEILAVITTQITEINAQLLQELLAIAENINYYAGVEAIAVITSKLTEIEPEILEQLLTTAQNIDHDFYKVKALTAIAPHLAEPRRTEILQKTLELARETKNIASYISCEDITFLITFAAQLRKYERIEERIEVLQQALGLVQNKIKDGVNIFATIAPHLSEFEPQLLQKIIEIVHNLERGDYQREALVAIAPYLPKSDPKVLEQALEIAHEIDNEYDRIKALASIAPHLREIQCTEMLHLALEITENVWQNFIIENLAFVASYLSKSQPEILQKAFNIVQNLKFSSDQTAAIVALAPHLSKLELQLLQQALKIALNIKESSSQFDALFAVIPHLPKSNSQLLEKAFEIVQTVEYGQARSRALVAVVPHLSESEPHLLHKALEITEKLVSPYDSAKAEALVAIAHQLPKSEPHLLQKALEIAEEINTDEQKDEALAAIASQLAQSEPPLLQQFFKIAQNTYYHSHHKHRIAIIPYLNEPQLTEILQKYFSATASSLASVVPHLPEPKHSEMLQQALEMLENVNDSDFYRAHALKTVVPLLSKTEQKEKAIEIAKTIKNDPSKGSEILAFVTMYLPEFKQEEEIIERLEAIEYNSEKARALAAVIPYLSKSSPEFLEKAFEIAENIKCQSCEVGDLVTLAPHLREPQRIKLLEQTLEKVEHIENEYQQIQAFASIISQLPKSESQLLYKVLEIVKKIEDESHLTDTIAAIALYLPFEAQLIQKFLDIIFQIKQKQNFIKALSQLAFRFPEEVASRITGYQFSAALEIIKQCKNDADVTKFLSALAPRLSSGLIPTALRIITENIIHPAYRAEAFSNLAPYIPKELCKETLNLIKKSIPGQYHRTQALCNLIPYLYISQIPQAVNIAENQIQDLSLKACILKNVAINLKEGQKNGLYEIAEIHYNANKILLLVKNIITNEQDKTEILTELITLLPGDNRDNIFEIIHNLKEEYYKAQVLSPLSLLPNLPKEEWTKIKKLVDTFKSQTAKCKVLTSSLTKDLSDEEFDNISSNIIDIAYNSQSLSEQTEILTELALYSPQEQHKALRAIRELNIPYLQYKYLERLVPHLQLNNLLEAQNIAQEIQDKYYEVKSLITLACKFPSVRTEAKRQAQNFKNKTEYSLQQQFIRGIELLCHLATEVPEILPDILKDLEKRKPEEEISGESNQSEEENYLTQWEQKQILIALKPHLPIRIAREIERERKKGKIPNELWHRSLRVLRKTYRDALSGGSFRNDTDLNEDLLNLKDEIDALANMLLMRDLEPPVAVGILGGWGGGKSYIMHLMQNRMLEVRNEGITTEEAWNEDPSSDQLYPYVGHIYQIKFDAWTYAKSHIWSSLMQTIFFELDRQITLEQQLIRVGINPCEKNCANVWQVIYQANEEDRKWFLERVLTNEQLENVKGNSGYLWKIFQESQQQAKQEFQKTKEDFENKRQELTEKQNEIKKKKLYKFQSLLQVQKSTELEKIIVTTGITLQRFIGNHALIEKIKSEVKEYEDSRQKLVKEKTQQEQKLSDLIDTLVKQEEQLNKTDREDNKTKEAKSNNDQLQKNKDKEITIQERIEKSKKDIEETTKDLEVKVTALKNLTVSLQNIFDKEYQKLFLEAIKQWLIKNYIIIFIALIFFAIVLIAIFNVRDPLKQLGAIITFLSPVLITLQHLLKSGQKWFDEFKLAFEETKTTFQQYEQQVDYRTKQLEDKLEQEVQKELQANSEVKKLQQEVQQLENQLKQQEQELPENTYATLSEFINARLKDGIYEQQLGIMHQVKQDLAALSYKLLPPAVDSKEYAAKIHYLKEAFPRGPARVVLYIDDLDRCSPDTVVQVLEAVQLLVKNRLFIAVIAIDERYINRALAKHYQGVLSRQGRPSPADYLEKIIQIPYRVTSIANSALRPYLKAQVVVQDSATSGNKFNEFSPEEFNILVQCCQEVDLSPRSLKRLTNVYKLFKILNRIQGHKSSEKEQQAILALLAFSGRYPDLMRDILQDIESSYEESRNQKLNKNILEFFQLSIQKHESKYENYPHLYQELQKLKYDTGKIIPRDLTLEDIKQIFDFVRRFSFVGDIGYDVDYQIGGTSRKTV